MSKAPQASAIPPSKGGVPPSPPQCRYEMRRPPTTPRASNLRPKKSIFYPPAKKARVSSPEESSTPPQPQSPTTESQIPSRMTLEGIIRHQPELKDSFHLLQRYHLEHLMTPRDFFYPRVALDFYQSMTTHRIRDPTVIHFTIDGRHGILGARHIAEALHIPYELVSPTDYKEWAHFSQSDMVHILSRGTFTRSFLLRKELPLGMFLLDVLLRSNIFPLQHMVQRRGAILEALFRISKGFYFGPHHLIMTSLLYFEEKHLGYSSEPQLECRRICREILIFDKWNHMTAYVAPPGAPARPAHLEIPQDEQSLQPQQPQQAEIPTKIILLAPAAPFTVPMPKVTFSTPPTIPRTPPVVPATSAPPPFESTITISASEFRGLCHTLQTLTTTQSVLAQQMAVIRAHQDQLIATQTQHTAILRQIQQHLGILMPPEHDMPGPSEPTDPSQEAPPAKHTMLHEETTTVEIKTPIQSTQTTTVEPSSPHDPPTTT
uniref:Uncharacterized protein n=1 Tax=Vitis vinifera TaxID=29760 RepID=A5AYB5_VITVI|nr:hypothetical protein VITISV_044325 [Vitis vinifera]